MTVPAVDPVVAGVVEMAELKRLLDEFVGAGHVAGTPEHDEEAGESTGQQEQADNTDFREGIGAAMKDLRHQTLCRAGPSGPAARNGGARLAGLPVDAHQEGQKSAFPCNDRLVPCCEKRIKPRTRLQNKAELRNSMRKRGLISASV